MPKNSDLFLPILPEEELHESFKTIANSPCHVGCRRLMNELFNEMGDSDGNFVKDFQSQGFDARTFELGLFAFLKECGLTFHNTNGRPDFIVNDGKDTVCIEATTSNPPAHLKLTNIHKNPQQLSQEQLFQKITDELPIRFGSPLFSKLNKRYWDLPQCSGHPLIFAIQAAHEPLASQYPVTSLLNYMFGIFSFPDWTEDGELLVKETPIQNHKVGQKIIPSKFFGTPETQHLSAVLFSNQLTISKFTRMAFQKGYQRKKLKIIRTGTFFNPDPNAAFPTPFKYELGTKGAIEETWAQGLSLILNVSADEIISPFYFNKVSTHIYLDGEVCSSTWDFHPLNSQTIILG